MLNFTSFAFGLISGFLLLITGGTLNFWVASEGLSIELIGLFSFVSLPYAVNFLWAPLLDKLNINFFENLNQRFTPLSILYLLGSVITFIMSFFDPSNNGLVIGILAFILSFINTSQDVLLNALRTEIIPAKHHASTSGIYIFGYRTGMVLSGSVAVFISDIISMSNIYKIFAITYLTFPILTFCILRNFKITPKTKQDISIEKIDFRKIFGFFKSFKLFIQFLLFLTLYRLADNFITIMLNPFLLESGFSTSEIALAGKFCGVTGSAIGGIVASRFLNNLSLIRSLYIFAIIHAFAHISYILVKFNPCTYILVTATLLESITGGMSMAAYIALISTICFGKFRATQYALFSAMMGVSRAILPSIAGILSLKIGWIYFFILSTLLIIPSLLLLRIIEKPLASILNDRSSNS